jgi:hypothetical protein
MDYSQQLDSQIQAAAAAKFGSVPITVHRYMDRTMDGRDREPWFALFVDGECLGRRRTKAELWQLLQATPE